MSDVAHTTCNSLCISLQLWCLLLCQTRTGGRGGEQNENISCEGCLQLTAAPRFAAGGSCWLVLRSLPCLPSLAAPHCEIPLSGNLSCGKDALF